MNTNKIVGLVVIVLVIVGIAVFSSRNSSTSSVKVGVISVLSGDNAQLGKNFVQGIEMARDEYVAENPGSKVELLIEDDGYDAAKGLEAYKKLSAQDIDALIVATSPTINSIYSTVASTTIPVITYGIQNVEETKDNVFHIFASPVFADMALGFALKSMSASSTQDIVGVYTNDQTLVNFYNAFKYSVGANITEYGLDLTMNNNPAAMKAVAQKVMAQKPKFVFMSNYANLGSQFIKELRALPGTKPTFAFDLTLNQSLPEYEKTLGDLKTLDGSLVVVPEKVDSKSFEDLYTAKYSTPVPELVNYGYDSLAVLLETRAANGDWIKNLGTVKAKGVTGTISFDEIGRRIPAFSIANISGGKIPEGK